MPTRVLLALLLALAACSKVSEPSSDFKPAEAPPEPPGPTKLEIVDEKVGTGAEAKDGDTVLVPAGSCTWNPPVMINACSNGSCKREAPGRPSLRLLPVGVAPCAAGANALTGAAPGGVTVTRPSCDTR